MALIENDDPLFVDPENDPLKVGEPIAPPVVEKVQNSGLFGDDYKTPQEAEDDCEKVHIANRNRDIQSAIRRRAVGALQHRKAWKILRFPNPTAFTKTRLGIGLNCYRKVVRLAEVEALIAKKCKCLHFLEMCVKDNFLAEIDEYAEHHHLAIVDELAKRQMPFKGINVTRVAEILGLNKKNGSNSRAYSHVKGDAGSTDAPDQEAFSFTEEEKASAWQATQDYMSLMREYVTVGTLSAKAIPFYVNSLKKG